MFSGSNPHSNGDIFSRFITYFFDNIKFKINSIKVIIMFIIKIINKIICIKRLNLLIGN